MNIISCQSKCSASNVEVLTVVQDTVAAAIVEGIQPVQVAADVLAEPHLDVVPIGRQARGHCTIREEVGLTTGGWWWGGGGSTDH